MRAVILSFACGCTALFAAEVVVRDLRLGAGLRSTGFDYTIQGATVDTSGSDAFDSGGAFEIGGRWSFANPGSALGLVVGLDAILEAMPYGDGGLGTTWLRAAGGGGWAVSDRLTLVTDIGLLAGASAFDNGEDQHQGASSQTGSAFAYDLRVEATWLVTRRIGVGLHLGWQRAKHSLSDDNIDSAIQRSGWIAGVQMAWRFSRAPARLE